MRWTPRRRRRCRAITVSARAVLIASSVPGAAVCSKRETVGCNARAATLNRVAPQQQFVDRILGEAVRVIAVGMATRDREDALREQIGDAVRDARRRPRIGDRRAERRQQPELAVGRFEHDRAAVRTRMGLIERRDQGPIGHVRKQNRLCYRQLVRRRSPPWGETPSSPQRITHSEAFVLQCNSLTRWSRGWARSSQGIGESAVDRLFSQNAGAPIQSMPRFPHPLIEPDVRISRIRLSDWFHAEAHDPDTDNGAPTDNHRAGRETCSAGEAPGPASGTLCRRVRE